jgi:hypothetical protein
MNSITAIFPYRDAGMWMFDDPTVGLRRELFVQGIDTIIETLTKELGLTNPHDGFRLIFSGTPFPGYTTYMIHEGRDKTTHMDMPDTKTGKMTRMFIPDVQRGNWYRHPETGMRGWLCPALLKYFDEAPDAIYVKMENDPEQAEKLAERQKATKLSPHTTYRYGAANAYGEFGAYGVYEELEFEEEEGDFVPGPRDPIPARQLQQEIPDHVPTRGGVWDRTRRRIFRTP